MRDKQRNRQVERWTSGWSDRQVDQKNNGQAVRQIDRHMHLQMVHLIKGVYKRRVCVC